MRLVGAHRPGYWGADDELDTGTAYGYSIDGGDPVPDPCSALLPDGLHGYTRVFDPVFDWTDDAWHGTDLARGVLMHVDVATFTPAGTLDAAAAQLPRIAELGASGVELSPVAAFDPARGPERGVRLFAVHEPYGGPRALQRFVDAAHAAGLAVVLDAPHRWAVADTLGLAAFGPYSAGSRIGPRKIGARPAALGSDSPRLNLDGSGSRGPRDFLVADAERWFREFHVDGMLLDVEVLLDRSAVPFLGELAEEVLELTEQLGRRLTLLTDGPGRSDRLTTAVDRILAAPGDPTRVDDLRRLAELVFPGARRALRQPSTQRRVQTATLRASSILVGDLTRLPAAARAVPWPATGAGTAPDADGRGCLLTFAILAGTPLVLDTEHVPLTETGPEAARFVEWTRRLVALRHEIGEEIGLAIEIDGDDHSPIVRRGRTAVVLSASEETTVVDLDAELPGGADAWTLVAAWKPDATTLHAGRLTVPGRSTAVLRARSRPQG
jgi:maltooligosyltrehalose trehalohydrolase